MTNAPKVTAAIVDLIARAPAFSNRQVTIAHPGQLAEPELVTILSVKAVEDARSLGKGHRRETLTVELGLVAEVNADDPQDALDRAYKMFSDIEEVIGGTPNLGVSNVLYAQIGSWDQRSFVGDGKRTVEITVDVNCVCNKDLEA